VKVSIDINPFLSKMKIPFFVISAVMCIFEFLNSALRSRNIARNELLLSLQIFYAIIAGLILLFYIVTSIRIIQRLKSRKNLGVKARSVSKRVSTSIINYIYAFILIFNADGSNFYFHGHLSCHLGFANVSCECFGPNRRWLRCKYSSFAYDHAFSINGSDFHFLG
jgi:hypothetical protein